MAEKALPYTRNGSFLQTLGFIHALGREFTLPQLIAKGQSHPRHRSERV